MTMTRRLPLGSNPRGRFEALYALIPDVQCKGLCYQSCGPIPMSAFEAGRLRAATGVSPSVNGQLTCVYLVDNRCAAYDARPTICRLYGAVDSPLLACPHGCAPREGQRLLTDAEARDILARAREIGGPSISLSLHP